MDIWNGLKIYQENTSNSLVKLCYSCVDSFDSILSAICSARYPDILCKSLYGSLDFRETLSSFICICTYIDTEHELPGEPEKISHV